MQALKVMMDAYDVGVSHHNGGFKVYKSVEEWHHEAVNQQSFAKSMLDGTHPELVWMVENLKKSFTEKCPPIIFFINLEGRMVLGLLENLKYFYYGHFILKKLVQGFGLRQGNWQLKDCISLLAVEFCNGKDVHAMVLSRFGDPQPLALLVRGLPEPSLN